jgi:hypothetical protein
VVLLFLYRCRVNYFVVLLLQILQYVANITRCAFDVFVELAASLDRSNSSIGSGE